MRFFRVYYIGTTDYRHLYFAAITTHRPYAYPCNTLV